MAITRNSTANERFVVKTFTSPLPEDLMFYEYRDSKIPKNKEFNYGDSYALHHAASTEYPNHKLIFVSSADEDGRQKWYFAADREHQDDYNYEIVTGAELTRTYIMPRELYREWDYARWIAEGEDERMWSYPIAGVDGYGDIGERTRSLDAVFDKYAFIDDTIRRIDKEFDSLYVTIQRRFVEPLTVEYKFDDTFDRSISITKEIVKPGTIPVTAVVGRQQEIQKGNVFHDVRITQAIVLNDGESYPYALDSKLSSVNHRFPSRLDMVQLWWAWAYADSTAANASYSEDFFFKFHVTDPRPGPYAAVNERWITDNPEDIRALKAITYVPQPVSESIAMNAAWFNASIHGNSTSATAKEWAIPGTIHEAIVIDMQGAEIGKSVFYWTQHLDATPGVTEFFAATKATIGYVTKELSMGLYEVSAVTIDIDDLYGDSYAGNGGVTEGGGVTVPVLPLDVGIRLGAAPATNISLQWTPLLVTGQDVNIYRATDAAGPFSLIASWDASKGVYNDSGLTPNTAYWYETSVSQDGTVTAQIPTVPATLTTAV